MLPKLCLGTAQFGMDYGITNKKGKINQKEIKEIIREASLENVEYIDTAQAYGDSEIRLGNTNFLNENFKIINKFSSQGNRKWNKVLVNHWEENLFNSLTKMKVSNFDSFLIHDYRDLYRKESDLLLNWMLDLKKRSIVKRIGISIYDLETLNKLPLEYFDVIQIPLSIYDQRFLKSGDINRLKGEGISIHVRSIFLQGLILQDHLKWPNFISNSFKLHHQKVSKKLSQNNFSMLEASLSFIYNCSDIESFLFGVTSIQEFKEIIQIWKSCKERNKKFKDLKINFDWNQTNEIDPRKWDKK